MQTQKANHTEATNSETPGIWDSEPAMLSATLGAGGMVPTPGTPATNATMAYATLSLLGDKKMQNDQKVCTGKTLESKSVKTKSVSHAVGSLQVIRTWALEFT